MKSNKKYVEKLLLFSVSLGTSSYSKHIGQVNEILKINGIETIKIK